MFDKIKNIMNENENNIGGVGWACGQIAAWVLAAGIIGLILWKLPVVEIVTTFFYIVIIPIVGLACLGWFPWSAAKALASVHKMGAAGTRERVEKILKEKSL